MKTTLRLILCLSALVLCIACVAWATEVTDEPTDCTHEWEDEIIEATCTEAGTHRTYCTLCGEELSTIELPPKGHASSGIVSIEAACTTDGSHAETCTVCKEIIHQTIQKAPGHSGGAYEPVNLPTCTETGEEVQICMVCKIEIDHREIPSNGHMMGDTRTSLEPTCTEKGCYQPFYQYHLHLAP